MNDQEINAFVQEQHEKVHEMMAERIKAETLAERRFTAAVAAMQGYLVGECIPSPQTVAMEAVKYADALLAALEGKK